MLGYGKEVDLSFPQAIGKVKDELKKEGFGVLTEINVKDTLKKKINVDYDDYMILGACNPPFAYKALQAVKDIGLMLPCNVIVYSDNGKIYVSARLPTESMSGIDNPALGDVAATVEEKIKKVINNI
jgi:uncharacterized protein (DUF302 family)